MALGADRFVRQLGILAGGHAAAPGVVAALAVRQAAEERRAPERGYRPRGDGADDGGVLQRAAGAGLGLSRCGGREGRCSESQ